ncbi:MAG: hypothetical protein AAF799_38810 [Myxococcota bacterium]
MFSPTYFRARATEIVPRPESFCALNVALYREGRKHWAFTEHPLRRVRRAAEHLELGRSRVQWDDGQLRIDIDERSTALGAPVRGVIRLRPTQRFGKAVALDPVARHHWWPVAPLAQVEVEMERPGFRFVGSGYHDTNFGREPLERGFSSWNWCRAETEAGTAILYDAQTLEGQPRERGLLFGVDGTIERLEAPAAHRLPRTGWGMERSTRTDVGFEPKVLRTLENAPFYSRSLIETQLRGEPVTAMHESLSLDRFCHPLVQRMLPYRIRRGWRA